MTKAQLQHGPISSRSKTFLASPKRPDRIGDHPNPRIQQQPGKNRPQRHPVHSPPPIAKVKNAWSCTSNRTRLHGVHESNCLHLQHERLQTSAQLHYRRGAGHRKVTIRSSGMWQRLVWQTGVNVSMDPATSIFRFDSKGQEMCLRTVGSPNYFYSGHPAVFTLIM